MDRGNRQDRVEKLVDQSADFICVSRTSLCDAVRSVLHGFFSHPDVFGLKLAKYEVDYIIGGILSHENLRLEDRHDVPKDNL